MKNLISSELSVINAGLERFAEPLAALGVPVVNCRWQPPAEGDAELGWKLARLINHPKIEAANKAAFGRYLSAAPLLTGVETAAEAIPALRGERLLLHSGPPISWADMCGPQKGAVIGAALLEGWAATPDEAAALAEKGEIKLDACHHHNAVGPMAGVISPGMPVWVVRDAESDAAAFSNFNEGLGKVLRFGANGPEVLDRLRWMRDILAPALKKTLASTGPIELKPLMAQALHMGDEVHNRNAAATSLLFRKLVPAALRLENAAAGELAEVFAFIAGNDHFFLNISMAACKLMLNAAAGTPGSSMLTAMARNGVNFGIQISAFPGRWFQAPAGYVEGLFFPGFGPDDAARDLGDSAITETCGLGGFAMAAAPAIVQFVGGGSDDALRNTLSMRAVTLGANPAFTLPALNFSGVPAGIDARLVADTGILPIINTGIAHKEAGVGQIGAGLTHAPLPCFTAAVAALYDSLGEEAEDER